MTGPRRFVRTPIVIPPWWQLLVAVAALAVLATCGLHAYTIAHPAPALKATPINLTVTVTTAPVPTPTPTPAPAKKK